MSNLMWERFGELRHALNALGERQHPVATSMRQRRVEGAQVVQFPVRR